MSVRISERNSFVLDAYDAYVSQAHDVHKKFQALESREDLSTRGLIERILHSQGGNKEENTLQKQANDWGYDFVVWINKDYMLAHKKWKQALIDHQGQIISLKNGSLTWANNIFVTQDKIVFELPSSIQLYRYVAFDHNLEETTIINQEGVNITSKIAKITKTTQSQLFGILKSPIASTKNGMFVAH